MALDHLRQDLRFGVRMMTRTPGLTALVVLTLAVGIGATTATFSILQAVLLRPLPYEDPGRLVAIWDGHVREKNLSKVFASYEDFEVWKANGRSFEQMAAVTWATGEQILNGRGPARVVLAIPATVDLFDLLGVAAMTGRTFQQSDLTAGCTVVLSHRFWQSTLGAPADVLGQSLALDDRACTVIGIMPARFAFFPQAADLWSLITPDSPIVRGGVGVFARLKDGVSLEVAQAELTALHRAHLGRDAHGATFTATAYPLQEEFTWLAGRNLRSTLLVLLGAVGLVLLIACVNVANVLLGRSVARQREFAVRVALGSGPSRLVRQLLTEGLLLSMLGAALGVVLAAWAVHYFRVAAPIELPPASDVAVDLRVLAFSAVLTIVTAIVCGLAPGLRASRVDLVGAFKGGDRSTSDSPRRRAVGNALVVAEMTCSVVLLVGAGLLIESVQRLGAVPLGFDPEGVVTMTLRLPAEKYGDATARTRFFENLTAAIGETPGIDGAAITSGFTRGRSNRVLQVEGQPAPSMDTAVPDVVQDAVSPDYFRLLKVPVLAGRSFDQRDRDEALPVAIVNEALARKYFLGTNPVGARVRLGVGVNTDRIWSTIVGVVGNEKGAALFQEMSLTENPALFRPVLQTALAQAALLVRARDTSTATTASVQRIVAAIDADVPVSDVQTLRDRVSRPLAYPQFRAAVLSGFAGLALLLAVVGLYGVLAQLVAHRTREIGIRMALGATKASALWLVARQGLVLAGTGLVVGVMSAIGLGRFLESMIYDVRPTDGVMLALVSGSLGLAAALATYLPARRAVRVDPVETLRHE